jgi:hypothetical protein
MGTLYGGVRENATRIERLSAGFATPAVKLDGDHLLSTRGLHKL